MQDYGTLALIAELAVAVLGFSGIVVVLGHRSTGEWSELERIRFHGMITTAAIVLILSLLPAPLVSAEMEGSRVWFWSSTAGGLIALAGPISSLAHIRRARLWSDPQVNKLSMAYGFVSGYGAPTLLFLNASGVLFGPTFTPFLIAVLMLFGAAILSFVRLLSDAFTTSMSTA